MKQSTNTFAQRRTRTEGTVTSVQSNQLDALKFGTEQFIADDDFVTRLNSGRSLRVKLGIDPTASDIHLGFAVVLNKLRQFQDRGHTAVLILGDFTALVGDPSGRSKTRPRLSVDEVNANAMTYVDQITDILDPAQLEVRRNSEWFGPMGMDGVLDLTSRYTVARMLERDDFANRYRSGTPISVSEFLYPLMQGWDSVMVEADVELGGTDQLFNLLVGRDLQRQMSQPAQAIVTMPLLEGLDGVNKMSKSLGNYIGITEPADDMFGKLMSVSDDLMWRYFELLSFRPHGEIAGLRLQVADGRNPRDVKFELAKEIVARFHDAGSAEVAQGHFIKRFRDHEIPTDLELLEIDAPATGSGIASVLRDAGLVGSNSEANRMIEQGAVRINGARVTDRDLVIKVNTELVLQVGKRRYKRIRLVPNG
ncbi:MAG: tyrosine--tRNA ligase [Actinobacteria bacterium]|nr:tyrosine--tRNA ligase [Actinomycetota bacterium]